MEGSNTEGIRESEQHAPGGERRFALLAVTALAAFVGLVALTAILLGRDSSAAGGTPTEGAALEQQTAFALFDEFHATLIVTPAAAGPNTVDLALATHDGSPVPEFAEVTLTATPVTGGEPAVATAEPVADSPGMYRAELALPEPGDWELTLTVAEAGSEPVAESAVVPIGAR